MLNGLVCPFLFIPFLAANVGGLYSSVTRKTAPELSEFTCVISGMTASFSGEGELTKSFVRQQGAWMKWTEAIVNEGITSLGNECFMQCVSLCRISLPSSLEILRADALQATSLVTFEVPKSVTTIEDKVWNSVVTLTSITVEEGNTIYSSDGTSLYKGTVLMCIPQACRALTIKDDTTEIYTNAGRWSYADEIVIPDAVTKIKYHAFRGCWMNKLVIGRMVSDIDLTAFSGCANLTKITVADGNTVFTADNGIFRSSNVLICVFSGTTVHVDHKVTRCASGSFCLNGALVSVTVAPEHGVFSAPSSGQYLLQGTVIVAGVGGCREVTIESSVTSIAMDAFFANRKLEKLIFEPRTTPIILERSAFGRSFLLKTIEFNEADVVIGVGSFGEVDLSEMTSLPQSITTVGNAGFSWNSIQRLSMPGVTSVEEEAFSRSWRLEEVSMPKVTTISRAAFSQCPCLRRVDFGTGRFLTSIGDLVFNKCLSLQTITLPGSITNLVSSAFAACSSLTAIEVTDSSMFTSVAGVVYTSDMASLIICPSGLVSVTLLTSTISISKLSFYGCNNLTEVVLNDGLERIEASAFCECESLSMIRIPARVSYIGSNVFILCPSLTTVLSCSLHDCSSFGDSPFPITSTVFVVFNYVGSTFCNHRVEKVLDAECNIATSHFTLSLNTRSSPLMFTTVSCLAYAILIA